MTDGEGGAAVFRHGVDAGKLNARTVVKLGGQCLIGCLRKSTLFVEYGQNAGVFLKG